MNTYKLGNKVTCIIRAYSSGKIGDVVMDYNNQPYKIVKSATANLGFKDIDTTAKSSFTQLAYNNSKLSQVQISDVTLNDKILNLIFLKSEVKLVSKVENQVADDNNLIYLTPIANEVYQVFIYNSKGELDKAIGTHNTDEPIIVSKPNKDYLVCYQYEANKGYSLDKPENMYFTLDLLVTGNKEDNTSDMNIHVEKCALKIDKNMYFNQHSNAVDLIFTVLDTGENYIALE